MTLRASHFIWMIKDGAVRKVDNMDSFGKPNLKFKKLEEVYKHADSDYTSLPFANRETIERNSYAVEENELDVASKENSFEELTLSQIMKKVKRKKRKASEAVILTPKAEDYDDFDLSEPLSKFRIKVSKSSCPKRVSANETCPTSSSSTQLVTSELTKDLATASVQVEDPEVEYFENNLDLHKGEKCKLNEVLFDSLDDFNYTEMDDEESITNVNRPPSIPRSLENDSFVKDQTARASDCSESQLFLQQTPENVIYIPALHDSDPTVDDEHDEDTVSMDPELPFSDENTNLTSMSTNADSASLVSNNITIHQEMLPTFLTDDDSEVKLDHDCQTGVMIQSDTPEPERLPLTRKFISPNSREKLCQAWTSAEPLDYIDHYQCKEKLYFGEETENMLPATKSDVDDTKASDTKFIQNKAVTGSKHLLKRPRNCKKGSPTKKGIALKGCLDGPRLCRSLPRLSTGCTSIERCSESAIAFSQRQMHDIESLASKLMSELNSMKVLVEEKMLYEAYRSPSLKNEADEIKSAIKSATKTDETARKWLSMMARDCNRFCKIMKLKKDDSKNTFGDDGEKEAPEREKKKISFADEAGGSLCDVKVFQTEQESPSLQSSSIN